MLLKPFPELCLHFQIACSLWSTVHNTNVFNKKQYIKTEKCYKFSHMRSRSQQMLAFLFVKWLKDPLHTLMWGMQRMVVCAGKKKTFSLLKDIHSIQNNIFHSTAASCNSQIYLQQRMAIFEFCPFLTNYTVEDLIIYLGCCWIFSLLSIQLSD